MGVRIVLVSREFICAVLQQGNVLPREDGARIRITAGLPPRRSSKRPVTSLLLAP